MANTFVIACPECEKQIKVSEEVVGRKIRCKECSTVFPVKAPRPAATKPKPEPKPAPQKQPVPAIDEDEDGKNPYALAKDDNDRPRCPHCTQELGSKEDRICVNCGYDLVNRIKRETHKVYEPSSEETFQWLLPGILCVVLMVILLSISIFCMVNTKEWMKDSIFHDTEDNKNRYIVKPGCFMLFNGMLTFYACYHLGRFAFKRLVLENKPPERKIEKDDEEDDEEEDD